MSFQVCWSDSIPCSHRDRRPPRTFPALSGASRPDSGPWTVSALPPYPFRSFKDFQRSFGERRVIHHRIDEQILVDEAATHLPAALLFGQRILDFLQLRPLTSRDPKKILRRDLACGLHQDHSVSDNHFELCPWLDPEPLYVCGYRRPPPVSHSRCATRFFALCVTTCIPHRMFRPLYYRRSHS